MQKVDDASYRKHFCKRRPDSNWSEKNKNLAADLEARRLMTDHGCAKIEEAKATGQRDAPKAPRVTEEDIESVASLLMPYELSHTNFLKMPPSARKTYAQAYLNAKTDAARERHLAWMVERLDKNLKPMETSACTEWTGGASHATALRPALAHSKRPSTATVTPCRDTQPYHLSCLIFQTSDS